jgi:glycosyltransferase involved in cell wall biosynthesis
VKKILFICPYPKGIAPSQRFRFEQYLRYLEEEGFQTEISPYFTPKAYAAFYQSGNLLSKIHSIIQSYLRRFTLLLQAQSFDFIFIHREITPLGPPVMEWLLTKVLRKKIIFDFDDAIWTTDNTNESLLTKWVRWRSKVQSICKWSHKVACGNDYLATFARRENSDVTVIPTTIDCFPLNESHTLKTGTSVVIGWTGSFSTLKYLKMLLPVLISLEKKYPSIKFLVIADRDPALPLRNYEFKHWRKETETQDLQAIDIGIMPLPDDEWTRGKCGFKALQYMAMSIPAVVSPIGVNTKIVTDGVEGFLCTTSDEWFSCLEDLILDPARRRDMGARGRKKVMDLYSMEANSRRFLSLFQ